jgi:dolichyl-phosphate beta-glucosyltransferase
LSSTRLSPYLTRVQCSERSLLAPTVTVEYSFWGSGPNPDRTPGGCWGRRQASRSAAGGSPINSPDVERDAKSGSRPWLSIVVPAFNEEARLLTSLQKIHDYLDRQDYSSEIIVVDDGSDDRTAAVAEALRTEIPTLRTICNPHRGKAYTVKTGVMASRGALIFLCDADLSMPIDEVGKFIPLFAQGYAVVIGSREAPGAQRFNEPEYRHVMGRVFNFLVRTVLFGEFQDTQCGFKCLSRDAALDLFPRLQVRTSEVEVKGPMVTGFDVELLYLARKLGYRVGEVGINWYYARGSKVNPVQDTLRLLSDLIKVRINDRRGFYDPPRSPSPEVTRG